VCVCVCVDEHVGVLSCIARGGSKVRPPGIEPGTV
jgi:hypothetical protein